MNMIASGGQHKDTAHFDTKAMEGTADGFGVNPAIGRDFSKVDHGRGAVDEHRGHPHHYGDQSLEAAHASRQASGQSPWSRPGSPMQGTGR